MAACNMKETYRCVVYAILLLLLPHILFAAEQEDADLPKIAIVGGGLGGTAAAYFLRQLFGNQLQVDVFEGKSVGGRLAVISIEGQEYEAGGSVIHPRNEYMVNLTKLFGLKRRNLKDDDGTMGLYDKDGLFFKTSIWKVVTIAKLFWRYGWDIKRIGEWVATMMSSFSRIYEYQEKGMAFTTVEDMLKAMDERFINYTRISAQTMFKDAGFSEIFINELVMSAMRVNYGQTTDTHGFVAAVSMAGVEPGLWAVKGGNKNVAESLLKASGARLIQGKVTDIYMIKSASGMPSYEVQYEQAGQQADQEGSSAEYDLVIMATPLDGNTKMKVKFEGFPSTFNIPNMPFHSMETLFVCGHVNLSTFGVDQQDELPDSILTTNAEVFFNSIGVLTPVDEISSKAGKPEKSEEYDVWKVFFNKVPTEVQVQALFDTRKSVQLMNWLAYPQYQPIKELPSFVLYDRLYFINAIEAAASAMEMSVIGAKNVALLAYNQWYSHLDKIDEVLVPSDSSQDSAQGKQVQDSVKSEEL